MTIESDRFFVNTEILAKISRRGCRVAQVPVTHLQRTAESSKVRFADVFRTIRELVRIRRSMNSAPEGPSR
jgi:phosphopantothenate synthetase